MPMITEGTLTRLSGHISIEEAEVLAEWLRVTPDALLDLTACEALHSAVLQVLLAARPSCTAPPTEPVLASLLSILPAEVPA